MTQQEAEQIAYLLNTRNQLPVEYTAEMIIRDAENYLFETQYSEVVGCVEVKRVQWYQWEIRHLCVREGHERKGLGKKLIHQAEGKAKQAGARISQCTIRVGNEKSEQAFRRSGYRETCCFYNIDTDKYIAVWQKVLSHRA